MTGPVSGGRCATCGFALGEPLATLHASELCFVSDRRFPGRCVVTLQQHATELFDLDPAVRSAFAHDISAAARTIRQATNAFKMNYEILGNADPHLHCHLIPRRLDEPRPKAPAWLHPEQQSELDVATAETLKRRIVHALSEATLR